MVLSVGNSTVTLPTPGGSNPFTTSHNNNGDYLLVSLAFSNAATISGITYNGVAMTKIISEDVSVVTSWQYMYGLASPALSTNNIIITFSNTIFNPVSICAVSFLDCDGIGNTYEPIGGDPDMKASPHTESITVSENSMIYAQSISSGGAFSDITIAGSSRSFLVDNANINNTTSSALSATELSAGSKDIVMTGGSQNSCLAVELLSAAPSNSGNFFMMFD